MGHRPPSLQEATPEIGADRISRRSFGSRLGRESAEASHVRVLWGSSGRPFTWILHLRRRPCQCGAACWEISAPATRYTQPTKSEHLMG